MKFLKLIGFFVLFSNFSFSQETLELMYFRIGSLKKYHFYSNDVLEYKTKGDKRFYKDKIAGFRDSSVFFQNGMEVKLSEIKCIRFRKNSFWVTLLRKLFFRAGVGFFALDTFNNVILDRPTIVNQKAVFISSAFIGASIVLYGMDFKRVRITKNKIFRITSFNYENLNKAK